MSGDRLSAEREQEIRAKSEEREWDESLELLAELAAVRADLAQARKERDEWKERATRFWHEGWEFERTNDTDGLPPEQRAEIQADAKYMALDAPTYYLVKTLTRIRQLEAALAAARDALAAYRSAVRCGERESDYLRELGEKALAGGGGDPA